MRLLFLLAAGALLTAAELTPALETWKNEIESKGATVVVVRVPTDASKNEISIPDSTPFRSILKTYLLQESFVAQLMRAHAMHVNYQGPEGSIHFILLNEALAGEWSSAEEAVIGHELGHAWLIASGYPAAGVRGQRLSCIATHANGMVQHILIRGELKRRGIDYKQSWIRNLDAALAKLREPAETAPFCLQLSQVELWVDVALGLETTEWPRRDEFLRLMFERFPEIEVPARAVEATLRGVELTDRAAYRTALVRTYGLLTVQVKKPEGKR